MINHLILSANFIALKLPFKALNCENQFKWIFSIQISILKTDSWPELPSVLFIVILLSYDWSLVRYVVHNMHQEDDIIQQA